MCSSSHYWHRKRIGLSGRVSNPEAHEVMGITHRMTNDQIGEAIPPAYAKYIALEAIRWIGRSAHDKTLPHITQ